MASGNGAFANREGKVMRADGVIKPVAELSNELRSSGQR